MRRMIERFAGAALIACVSCSNPDPLPMEPVAQQGRPGVPAIDVGNRIDFERPVVGQENRYARWTSPRQSDTSQAFRGDTLIVRVVDVTAEFMVLEERLSAGSAARRDSTVTQPDSANRYRLSTGKYFVDRYDPGPLQFSDGVTSPFLFAVARWDTIVRTQVQTRGWRLAVDDCDCHFKAIVIGHWQHGHFYDTLSVVSSHAMGVDAPGHLVYFSDRDGIVRAAEIIARRRNRAIGWDLL